MNTTDIYFHNYGRYAPIVHRIISTRSSTHAIESQVDLRSEDNRHPLWEWVGLWFRVCV